MRFERPAAVSPRDGVQRKRPEAAGGAPASAIAPYGQSKSLAPASVHPSMPVSIAAQRCNLARSLLEWRLHGSRTLGNMDWDARRTIKNHGAAEWRGSRMSVGRTLFAATLAGMLALTMS